MQGDSQIDNQKNQGDSWLLVHVWINSCLVLDKLGFEEKNYKFGIFVSIFELKIHKVNICKFVDFLQKWTIQK